MPGELLQGEIPAGEGGACLNSAPRERRARATPRASDRSLSCRNALTRARAEDFFGLAVQGV
jgi:hypothetical protein